MFKVSFIISSAAGFVSFIVGVKIIGGTINFISLSALESESEAVKIIVALKLSFDGIKSKMLPVNFSLTSSASETPKASASPSSSVKYAERFNAADSFIANSSGPFHSGL